MNGYLPAPSGRTANGSLTPAGDNLLDFEGRGVELLRCRVFVLDRENDGFAGRNVDHRWGETVVLDGQRNGRLVVRACGRADKECWPEWPASRASGPNHHPDCVAFRPRNCKLKKCSRGRLHPGRKPVRPYCCTCELIASVPRPGWCRLRHGDPGAGAISRLTLIVVPGPSAEVRGPGRVASVLCRRTVCLSLSRSG